MNIYNTLHAGSVTHNLLGLGCRECIENLNRQRHKRELQKKCDMMNEGICAVGMHVD